MKTCQQIPTILTLMLTLLVPAAADSDMVTVEINFVVSDWCPGKLFYFGCIDNPELIPPPTDPVIGSASAQYDPALVNPVGTTQFPDQPLLTLDLTIDGYAHPPGDGFAALKFVDGELEEMYIAGLIETGGDIPVAEEHDYVFIFYVDSNTSLYHVYTSENYSPDNSIGFLGGFRSETEEIEFVINGEPLATEQSSWGEIKQLFR